MTAILSDQPRDLVRQVERAAFATLRRDAGRHVAHAPQQYKDALRLHYHALPDDSHALAACRQGLGCYARAQERLRGFWAAYEQVNRDYLPDDPVYSVERSGVALSTSADFYTFIAASAGQFRVLEIIWGGEATSSAVNRISHQRSTGGTTGTGAITPEKFNTRSPAAATVVDTAWTGQPALSGNPWWSLAMNAFGGYVDWKAAPGSEVYCVNSEQLSLRSASGTSTFSNTLIFEEL